MLTYFEKRMLREEQFRSDLAANPTQYDALQEQYVEDMNALDVEESRRLGHPSDPPGHPIRK